MEIKKFIKSELTGWKKSEIICLILVFTVILVNAFILKDSPVAVMSAICGILYTMIAGKGKVSCYIFGLMGSGCYSYLSFHNALFGNLILYAGYYIPMQILGIFKWKNNLKKETNEIFKTKLNKQETLKLTSFAIIASILVIVLLYDINDKSPYIDGITTVLSIIGMYLTVKRCVEQWLVWIVVNGLSLLMWLDLVLKGSRAYATVIMWAVYFILAIYFYFTWKKEIKN
ncbi:MAG: nicotinamide riboside transporter PnuC [Clostridiaceae bacterium]|nr:nicotinamide riboside transporter PnuC [Clostridiaceae bacterium]